jgi:hypothetical protein
LLIGAGMRRFTACLALPLLLWGRAASAQQATQVTETGAPTLLVRGTFGIPDYGGVSASLLPYGPFEVEAGGASYFKTVYLRVGAGLNLFDLRDPQSGRGWQGRVSGLAGFRYLDGPHVDAVAAGEIMLWMSHRIALAGQISVGAMYCPECIGRSFLGSAPQKDPWFPEIRLAGGLVFSL